MPPNHRISHAVVVLPAGLHGGVRRRAQRRWLAGGRLRRDAPGESVFARVLRACGLPAPNEGHAALRLWGQTGSRPATWVAAADPVHLEARLDHLRVHALPEDSVTASDLASLFADLQAALGGEVSLRAVGNRGYLFADAPMATASAAPRSVHGARPEDYLPAGPGALAHDRLLGEIQLALHEHALNRRLEDAGVQRVNSLWLWGGGAAPPATARTLPDLYADEPLLRGYWLSGGATVLPCPERLSEALESAPRPVVLATAEAPEDSSAAALEEHLDALRAMMRHGEIGRLTLLFRDGLRAELGRYAGLLFWRRVPALLEEPRADD